MEKILGVPIIIINKPGASSAIATTFVANADPDGYSLLFTITPYPITAKLQEPSLTYGTQNLTFLGASHTAHVFLTVSSKSPWKTYEEFVDYAKKNPVKFANVGGVSPEGTVQQAHFAKFLGFKKMTQVPYAGASQKANALLGGEVDADLAIVPAANFVKSGDLRWLVVFAPQRHPFYPEIPAITEKEKGYDVMVTFRSAMIGPKGLPTDVINKLTKAFKEAANSEQGRVMFRNLVYMPDYKTPEECLELWKLDEKLYDKFVVRKPG